MSMNADRAQRIVGGVIDRLTADKSGVPVATRIVQALADAGLLMPDLPEPEMQDGLTVWRVDEEGFVYIKPNGWITTLGVETPYDSPHIAYRHALAILAAADYAEQEQDNG